jgi:hypothetical protein
MLGLSSHVATFSDERMVIDLVGNHAEFKRKLVTLSLTSDLKTWDDAVAGVARSWFNLARQHATEMRALDAAISPRALYSRAYYAAYTASKCVRYVVRGAVSLKGDDHRRVADLPDSFPDVATWARRLQEMYEHRLRADYDNWSGTPSENSLQPDQCAQFAFEFLSRCEEFLNREYGLAL